MADEWVFPKGGELMRGKRGRHGRANDKSIAWGIAQQLAAQGAEIAFTYQGEALKSASVRWPKASVRRSSSNATRPTTSTRCRVRSPENDMGQRTFRPPIAFSDKNELKGSFIENTRARTSCARWIFQRSLSSPPASARQSSWIAWRLDADAHLSRRRTRAAELQRHGVAKVALEACTATCARPCPEGKRVNAISAGHAHTRHRRHPRRTRPHQHRPRMVGDEGRHQHGRHRRLCAVAAQTSAAHRPRAK